MNPEVILAGLATAALVVVLIRNHHGRKPGLDVGVDIVDCGMVADVDEDIHHPSLEAIDLALRHMDRDNAGAVDWLLEKRLEAMRREAAS